MQSEIFQKPYAIQPTLEVLPTPAEYIAETRDNGLGMTMPMWRVQTEGYRDGTDQMIGLVSRERGFFDSPDTEIMASGVNTKSSGGVAIGRHGNFMLWGFAASPTYLTEEAKLVFINSVHYISKFAGVGVVARKKPGTILRAGLENTIRDLEKPGWNEVMARHQAKVQDFRLMQDALRERQAAGEMLQIADLETLKVSELRVPDRFRAARSFFGDEEWEALGEDPDRIASRLREIGPYLYPVDWYELAVDEDLKSRGLANNAPDFVALLIADLESEGTRVTALAALRRYTAESFDTSEAWGSWYAESGDRLFFSEASGYKWLVAPVVVQAVEAGSSHSR